MPLLSTGHVFFAAFLLFLLSSQNSFAQTRVIANPGLEFGVAAITYGQYDANFGFSPNVDAGSAVTSPWYTSHPTQAGACEPGGSGNCHPIEIWGTGYKSVPATQGSNFVELNAYVNSMIYQNMYLVNGDIITYDPGNQFHRYTNCFPYAGKQHLPHYHTRRKL